MPAVNASAERRFANDLRITGEEIAVDEFVARVLGRAHRAAHVHAAPEEARLILDLAHRFADELAGFGVVFDRERFIDAVMEESA